jgi:hypothetical protein
MFGTSLLDRRSKPERIADQAWEYLVSAVNTAGDGARSTATDVARSARHGTSHLAEEAGDLVGGAADEAWQRARAAVDALAGRRQGLPWLWIVGAGVAGAMIGWAAGSAARNARDGSADGKLEFVDVDRPDSAISLDT